MKTKLYVGNLAYGVSNVTLSDLFSQYGKVSKATIIIDRHTGKSKGFGFIEMTSAEEAQAAIAGLNGALHEGRALSVNEAKPRPDTEGTGTSLS
ncbi:MAG: RNA-binding protein [Myxococcales bacterium]|nr:RNA-binding protein [Myxococcales bacterium]